MKITKTGIINHGTFGELSRYKLTSMVDRFGNNVWFVADADKIDELTGLPVIIRQTTTKEDALSGLT